MFRTTAETESEVLPVKYGQFPSRIADYLPFQCGSCNYVVIFITLFGCQLQCGIHLLCMDTSGFGYGSLAWNSDHVFRLLPLSDMFLTKR